MSTNAAAPAAPQSKAMSSRLLTMKFMQRAAASGPAGSRAARRDSAALKAANEVEAAARDLAAQKMRAAAGVAEGDTETRWELSWQRRPAARSAAAEVGMAELHGAGYHSNSSDDDDEDGADGEDGEGADGADDGMEEAEDAGRIVFGNFRKKTFTDGADHGHGHGHGEGNDESSSEDTDGERKPRTRTPKRKFPAAGDEPSLEGLQGISNAGRSGGTPGSASRCHACGNTGHLAARCPSKKCFACGEHGHNRAECPTPPKKRKVEGRGGYAGGTGAPGQRSGPLAVGRKVRY